MVSTSVKSFVISVSTLSATSIATTVSSHMSASAKKAISGLTMMIAFHLPIVHQKSYSKITKKINNHDDPFYILNNKLSSFLRKIDIFCVHSCL